MRGASILGALALLVSVPSCKEQRVVAVDVAVVRVAATTARLSVGQTTRLTVRVEDEAGRTLRRSVVWSSSQPGVASVAADGTVTAHTVGDVTITASVDGHSDGVDLSVADESIATVDVLPSFAVLQIGDTLRLRAVARTQNGTELPGRAVSWTTTDPNVVEVGINGLVTALAAGSVTITATVEGVRGEAQVTVNASLMTVSSVRVDPSTATVASGDSVKLAATALTSNGGVIAGRTAVWTSGNSAVAAVSPAGMVRGLAPGSANITATIDGVSGTAVVTVTAAAISSLTVAPRSSTLAIGSTLQLQATIRATDGSVVTGVPITWATSDAVIASVDAAGLVTAKAVGSAMVAASGGGVSDTASVFVVVQPVSALHITPASPTLFAGDSLLLDANPVDGGGNPLTGRQVTWSTADAAVATAVATGPLTQQAVLHGIAAGATWVIAETGARKDSTRVTVNPRLDVAVTKTASAVVVSAGDTVTFTIDVSNLGQADATAITVADTLPLNAKLVGASGSPVAAGNLLTWQIASLGVGASAQYTVRLEAPASGTVRNVATAFASNGEAAPADNVSAVVVGVNALADLVVRKAASAASVDAGGSIDYQVIVRNIGLSDATSVVVTDTLPVNAAFVSASGSPAVSGNVLIWPMPTLAVGDSVVFDVRVTAPNQGAVVNVGAAETATGEASLSNNSASVSTTVNSANLAIVKTGPATAAPGDAVSYSIQVTNNGPGLAANLSISDTLPAGATYVGSSNGGSESGGTVTWPVIATLASGASVTYTVDITAAATGPMRNVAAVAAATLDPDLTDNTSTVTTAVAQADLSVTKSGPVTVTAGSAMTYTLDVKNGGPTAAASAMLVDSLPPGVAFISSTVLPSAVSGNTTSGIVLAWGPTTLASGGSITIDVQALAPPNAATLTNVARVGSTTTDPDLTNNRSTAATTVVPAANLAVAKTGPASAAPGSNVTWTVDVSNAGPSTATAVVVSDTLPAGVTFVSATGGATEIGGVVTWSPAGGDLVSGGNGSFTVTVTLPTTAGSYTNVARVSSATTDPDASDDRATATTDVTAADLSVAKTYTGPVNPTALDTLVFTITVDNAGPSAASAVVVTDTLPANATFVSSSPAASPSGNVLTWNVQSLAASGQSVFTVRMLGPAAGGSVTNAAAVTSSTTDLQPANNHSTVSTSVAPAADLGITNVPSTTLVSAGDTIVYTIDATNAGPSDASGVEVSDTLPSSAGFIDATGGPVLNGNVLTWAVGSLPAAGSVSYTVRYQAGAAGTVTNVAAVKSTTADPVSSNNVSATTAAVMTADIDVAILAPSSVSFGSQMTYTVLAINQGPGRAIGVTAQSPPATNALYVSHSAGTRDPVTGVISLTGDVAAGDTLQFSVTVSPSGVGDVGMSASAASASIDPNPSNDNATATTTLSTSAADLTVTVSSAPGSVLVGQSIVYTITVLNNGPGDALGLNLTATLPPSSLATFVGADGAFIKVGDTLTWNGLTLGRGTSVTYSVVVDAAAAGSLTLSASATALNNDPKPGDNSDSATTTAN